MSTVMGAKGQVVIRKDIRDHLGIGPGWRTVQLIVDGHVEVHFVPPAHRKSLRGALARRPAVRIRPGEAWTRARAKAWRRAAAEKMGHRERG